MAVYTTVSENDIARLKALYALQGKVVLKPIAEGVENSNYLLLNGEEKFILTLYEQRVSKADLPFFLGLLKHLSARGVPCPVPIVAIGNGEVIQEVADRPASMVSFLEGASVKRIAPWHCAELGRNLAQMHIAAAGYGLSRENNLSYKGWVQLWQNCREKAGREWPQIPDVVDAAFARLEKEWPRDLPKAVIHADLFPDNVFFDDQKLTGLIDFYFACVDMVAYDLAICLNAWCFETNREFNITRSQRLLEAYGEIRPLSEAEKQAFPILCLGASLRFLLTRMTDWLNPKPGALVTPKDPLEYFEKLKFHSNAKDFRDYGI